MSNIASNRDENFKMDHILKIHQILKLFIARHGSGMYSSIFNFFLNRVLILSQF